MESFLYSTALAFIVYQIIAYARPAFIEHFIANFERGLSEKAVVWLRRGIFAGLAILILYLVLVVHIPFHIDTSRTRVNVIAGLFCGPLLAIWVNSVLNSPADKGLSKGQIAGLCGLAALAVLGSIGDNGAKLLQHYSRNISGLSIAGAALQFATNDHRNATPGAPSTPPAGHTGTAVATSQGLQYAGNVGSWFITNDVAYLKLLKPADPTASGALDVIQTFAKTVIEPPLQCLFVWQYAGTDPVSVTRHLRDFAEAFQYLRLIGNDDYRGKFATAFANQTALLATDAVFRPPPPGKDNPCDKLADLSADAVNKNISTLPKDEYQQRPYLAIAYAGLLAQLNHYAAATGVLASWLQNFPNARATNTSPVSNWTAADWLEIRLRSILAAFTEEWIESDEANIATPVRDAHLSNLDIVLGKLKASLDGSDLLKTVDRGASVRFIEPSTCRLNEQDVGRRLFTAYVTIDLVYWQNTLVHPAYDRNFAMQTTDALDALVQTDVSCVANIDATLLYAQILDAYAHNAILYTSASRRIEDDDDRTTRLTTALAAAQLGQELAKKAEQTENRVIANYFDRIARNDSQQTWEALHADANYLERLKGE